MQISLQQPYFFVNNAKVFYMFDTPHLLKSTRNQFFVHTFQIDEGITDKKFLELYYNHTKQLRYRQSYKLTDAHVNPNSFEKMRVKLAAQIFSQSVAAGMEVYISHASEKFSLSQEAYATITFIDTMDKLFDIFNSSPGAENIT